MGSDEPVVLLRPYVVRPRRDPDLPHLAELLVEQQAASQYPVRWPLPVPVEKFLVRPTEERAWVAVDGAGRLLGHVAVHGLGDDDVSEALRAALVDHRGGGAAAGVVAVLFTSAASRGTGVGGLLFDTAVTWIIDDGRTPVLDVVPAHAAALDFYRHRGWVEIGTFHPPWLGADLVLMTPGSA